MTTDSTRRGQTTAAGPSSRRRRREAEPDGRSPAPEDPTERAVDAVTGAEPMPGIDAPELLTAVGRMFTAGGGVFRETVNLATEMVKVAAGRSTIAPERGDWRFADPAWSDHPGYHRLMQGYLAWSNALLRLADNAELDWKTAERARFAMTLLTSAASPTNTLLGNPAALKRAFETGGTSLVRGTQHMVHDLRHNGGMPSQVDTRPFKVGENLAATPGAVVYRDDVFELIQYQPATETVRARPVLMIPPQINKYYFMDLAPGRSFIEYAVSRGIQFFAISWRNPTADQGHWDLDTYASSCLQAMDVVTDVAESEDLNLLGLCAGGITTAVTVAHMAAAGDRRANAVSFAVTLLDFSVPSMIGMFLSRQLLSVAAGRSRKAGVLTSQDLGRVFNWLRPNDLVWNYWVNNYLLGKDPPAFDILAWNNDGTRLPAALHADFLDLFEHNCLQTPGALTVLGTPIDLSTIQCDAFVTGALTDHLTPWKACYQTTQMLGGRSEFILSSSGHIQSLVNPPGNPKARYFSGPEPGPDPDTWLAEATQHTGTWWDLWADWMRARGGDDKPAPQKLGNRRFPALDPAPGTYIYQN